MLVLDGQTDTDSQLTERDRPCSDDGLILVSGIGTDPGSCLVEERLRLCPQRSPLDVRCWRRSGFLSGRRGLYLLR